MAQLQLVVANIANEVHARWQRMQLPDVQSGNVAPAGAWFVLADSWFLSVSGGRGSDTSTWVTVTWATSNTKISRKGGFC